MLLLSLLAVSPATGQFRADFESEALALDPRGLTGWAYFTGDGAATIDLVQSDGHASVVVDARADTLNIWWALLKHQVSTSIDVDLLSEPGFELRVEARVRASAAPRRVNLHANTHRTTDFHSHLMEYDIPDTTRWHTISMTTRDFDAAPGDTVYVQLAMMDWGNEVYRVDLDYLRADVVDTSSAAPDLGEPLPYHPPLPDPGSFEFSIPSAEQAMIDSAFPGLNFRSWVAHRAKDPVSVVTVSGPQWVILRWDLREFQGFRASKMGLLELPTFSLQRARHDVPELGQIRVVEIVGGRTDWDRDSVTYVSFLNEQPLHDVVNGQMIVDVEVADEPDGTTWATIPRPVLQRLLDGTTTGLLIRPLGPVSASFAVNDGERQTRLHFTAASDEGL